MRLTFLGTGAGSSTLRAHTGTWRWNVPMAPSCCSIPAPETPRFAMPTTLGMSLREFDDVLLSHDHPDHMSGIDFVQFDRALFGEDKGPLRVHASYEALEGLKRHCLATRLNIWDISGDFGRNFEGREFLKWCPAPAGQPIELGPRTIAWHFPADHITGASGWRIECDGKAVVFSGDTRYSPEVAKAAEGADLLIHEAFCVTDSVPGQQCRPLHRRGGWASRRGGQGRQPCSDPPHRRIPRQSRTPRRGGRSVLPRSHHHSPGLRADHPRMNGLEIIFLGTGAGLSTKRAHTAIALSCPDGGPCCCWTAAQGTRPYDTGKWLASSPTITTTYCCPMTTRTTCQG